MEVTAYHKYLKISPKKMKGVGNAVTGLNAYKAIDKLNLLSGKRGNVMIKVIKSALSNAKNNNKLDANSMMIKSVEILKGPFSKRWQPVSKGMAHAIKKRTAHLRVVLMEKVEKIREVAKVEKVETVEKGEKVETMEKTGKVEEVVTDKKEKNNRN